MVWLCFHKLMPTSTLLRWLNELEICYHNKITLFVQTVFIVPPSISVCMCVRVIERERAGVHACVLTFVSLAWMDMIVGWDNETLQTLTEARSASMVTWCTPEEVYLDMRVVMATEVCMYAHV